MRWCHFSVLCVPVGVYFARPNTAICNVSSQALTHAKESANACVLVPANCSHRHRRACVTALDWVCASSLVESLLSLANRLSNSGGGQVCKIEKAATASPQRRRVKTVVTACVRLCGAHPKPGVLEHTYGPSVDARCK